MATAREACLADTANRVDLSGYSDPSEGFVRYGSWTNRKDGEWYAPRYLSGSYYSGGYVCRSNYEAFCEEFPNATDEGWALETPGGHQTYGVLLHCEKTPDEAWEMVTALEDYPVVDEERLSQLESDAADEAWEAFYERDWRKMVCEQFADEDCDADALDEANVDWRQHFETAREAANTYWEAQGDEQSMWVDLKRALEHAEDPNDILDAEERELGQGDVEQSN